MFLLRALARGGTITGCARALKALKSDMKVIAVEPETSAVLSGNPPGAHKIQGIGPGFVPNVLDMDLIDEVVTIPDETAFDTARVLARIEGIAGGISTGANVAAAMMLATRDEFVGKNIVTFAPSGADRYLSTPLFHDDDQDAEGV